jgi:hypothetical protein
MTSARRPRTVRGADGTVVLRRYTRENIDDICERDALNALNVTDPAMKATLQCLARARELADTYKQLHDEGHPLYRVLEQQLLCNDEPGLADAIRSAQRCVAEWDRVLAEARLDPRPAPPPADGHVQRRRARHGRDCRR